LVIRAVGAGNQFTVSTESGEPGFQIKLLGSGIVQLAGNNVDNAVRNTELNSKNRERERERERKREREREREKSEVECVEKKKVAKKNRPICRNLQQS
jgi:hypothetical protein